MKNEENFVRKRANRVAWFIMLFPFLLPIIAFVFAGGSIFISQYFVRLLSEYVIWP